MTLSTAARREGGYAMMLYRAMGFISWLLLFHLSFRRRLVQSSPITFNDTMTYQMVIRKFLLI
jgi:hypothetical protein